MEEQVYEGELEDTTVEEETEFVWESLALKEFPVKIAGEQYVLVETSAEDARKWRANNLQSLTSLEKGKGKNRESRVSFLETLATSQLLLVSLCLYKVTDDKRVRVSREVISKWPNELVRQLFVRAQKLSGLRDLDEEDEDENKDPNRGNSHTKRILGAE